MLYYTYMYYIYVYYSTNSCRGTKYAIRWYACSLARHTPQFRGVARETRYACWSRSRGEREGLTCETSIACACASIASSRPQAPPYVRRARDPGPGDEAKYALRICYAYPAALTFCTRAIMYRSRATSIFKV